LIYPLESDAPSGYPDETIPSDDKQPAQKAIVREPRKFAGRRSRLSSPRVDERDTNVVIIGVRRIDRDELNSREHNTRKTIRLFVLSNIGFNTADVHVEIKGGFTSGVVHLQSHQLSIVEPVRQGSPKFIERHWTLGQTREFSRSELPTVIHSCSSFVCSGAFNFTHVVHFITRSKLTDLISAF